VGARQEGGAAVGRVQTHTRVMSCASVARLAARAWPSPRRKGLPRRMRQPGTSAAQAHVHAFMEGGCWWGTACGRLGMGGTAESSPGADVEGACRVPVQMWVRGCG
jgi:hypothetical protein